MTLESFGQVKISSAGQASLPVELRRALQIENKTRSLQVFADVDAREIRLIEGVDAESLYELLRQLNRDASDGGSPGSG